MMPRVATILSALALTAPLAAAAPAQAAPDRGLSPEPSAWVSPRETRAIRVALADGRYAPAAWYPWTPVAEARPFTRFDIEGIRLLTRMP